MTMNLTDMKKIASLLIVILSFATVRSQQNALYTNYRFNEFAYNPALAGSKDYLDTRFCFRNQWQGLDGGPKTVLFSMNSRIKDIPLGLGGLFNYDMTGPLKRTNMSVSLAYVLDMEKGGKLSAGLSGGVFRIVLEDDINPVNPTDATLANAKESRWVPDAGLGVYYTVKGFYTGFSIPQIFQSDIDFGTSDPNNMNKLIRHYNFVVGKEFKIGEHFKLDPSVLLKAVKAAPVQVDIALIGTIYDLFWIGPSYRTGDAVAVMAGFNIKDQFEIGYSYDFTTSELNDFSNGSHEIVLKYKLSYKKDTDGDGVLDKKDKCPDVPGVAENDGCPETDKDADGVVDRLDKCPDEAGLASNEGCPLAAKDKDGDGVVDSLDNCPATVGPAENKGCPIIKEEQKEVIDKALANLEFETNKDKIKDYSLPYLDRLADILNENKDWKIRLAGHTDNTGTPEHNMKLSKDRASAVMFYLLSKGVSKSRIIVESYGDTKPIATNDTEDGKQQNRRVEMEFVFD